MTYREDYADLAWGLLHGSLAEGEKRLALQLVASDPEFGEALKLEIALAKELEQLKASMPPAAKRQVYSALQETVAQEMFKAVLGSVLQTTLPRLAWPVWQIFERSVLVGEQL